MKTQVHTTRFLSNFSAGKVKRAKSTHYVDTFVQDQCTVFLCIATTVSNCD